MPNHPEKQQISPEDLLATIAPLYQRAEELREAVTEFKETGLSELLATINSRQVSGDDEQLNELCSKLESLERFTTAPNGWCVPVRTNLDDGTNKTKELEELKHWLRAMDADGGDSWNEMAARNATLFDATPRGLFWVERSCEWIGMPPNEMLKNIELMERGEFLDWEGDDEYGVYDALWNMAASFYVNLEVLFKDEKPSLG